MPSHVSNGKTTVLRAIHIPKCGGTSVAWSFDSERSRYFGREWSEIAAACHARSASAFGHVIVQGWHHWTYDQWMDWDGCQGDVYDRTCNLTRRYRPGVFRYIAPTVRVVVVGIFRDPVERFKSAFRSTIGASVEDHPCGFLRCRRGSAIERRYRAFNISVNELAHLYPSSEFASQHNLQVKFMGLRDAYEHPTPKWEYVLRRSPRRWQRVGHASPSQGDMRRAFALATRRVESLDVVGVLDSTRYASSVYRIGRALGVQMEHFCSLRNVPKTLPKRVPSGAVTLASRAAAVSERLLRRWLVGGWSVATRAPPPTAPWEPPPDESARRARLADSLDDEGARRVRAADHLDVLLHRRAIQLFDEREARDGLRAHASCSVTRPICERSVSEAREHDLSDRVCGHVCRLQVLRTRTTLPDRLGEQQREKVTRGY